MIYVYLGSKLEKMFITLPITLVTAVKKLNKAVKNLNFIQDAEIRHLNLKSFQK